MDVESVTSDTEHFQDANSSCATQINCRSPRKEDFEVKDGINSKIYKIALELLSTERSYVSVLHLIDQVNKRFMKTKSIYMTIFRVTNTEDMKGL